ncbi:hemerythrin domain-containing protein [Oceanibacterium hippocampi]|uniref:Hemerythrin HHE cation binding domain protein n=1 Tax=Oceanibacterium hippocampi TaxID=745714 RepID=A0A1Y5U0G1_9PROT|nr:hemerythrin domain-containing protein [Oceanibacterium hippocampi]SLN77731.1 Hemerythrin HHE cation binding domain protein [Oceanibacterium hippocampi]
MTHLIRQIQTDHRNLNRMLAALERQLERFRNGEQPAWDLISDVVEYCDVYPDRVHHPKEDLVYERMVKRDPGLAAGIGDLRDEHRRLAELSKRFASLVEAVLADTQLPRATVAEAIETFIRANREHMMKEEAEFLPLARRLLSEADWRALEAVVEASDDPLFGAGNEGRFADLRREILEIDAERSRNRG